MKLPLNMQLYVVTDPDGDIVGLDDASGGCAFKATTIGTIEFFHSREAAENYARVSNGGRDRGYRSHLVNVVTL